MERYSDREARENYAHCREGRELARAAMALVAKYKRMEKVEQQKGKDDARKSAV